MRTDPGTKSINVPFTIQCRRLTVGGASPSLSPSQPFAVPRRCAASGAAAATPQVRPKFAAATCAQVSRGRSSERRTSDGPLGCRSGHKAPVIRTYATFATSADARRGCRSSQMRQARRFWGALVEMVLGAAVERARQS